MSNNFGDKYTVFPSPMEQMLMKNRLRTAQVGHDLLKRKSDALVVRFRNILSRIVDTKTLMGEVIKEASWSLAEAKYTMGDFGEQIIQDVDKASVKVKTKLENVVGVKLRTFVRVKDKVHMIHLTGLSRGGQQMKRVRENYEKAIDLVIEIASLQTSFFQLDEVIRVINRRVNAIEHKNTIRYIAAELDEMEREEYFRLKKIKEKNNQRRKAQNNASEATSNQAPSILDAELDEDILF